MVYLPALAVHQSTTSLSLERQTRFLFWIEPEWLKLGLRCLTCTSPTEQFSNVREPAGGLGLPQGLLLLSFAGTTWPNPFAQRFLLGTVGDTAAGSSAGLGPLVVLLHNVSHGQSPAAGGFPALPGCG